MKKTIYDIAKELNVAPSTVSKSLNGVKGVSEKTRKRIIRYANKVRYIPSASASQLKTKRSFSIGIIYSENLNIGLEHHFFSSVIQAFKDYVETRGYEITFVIRNLGQTEMTYLEFCRYKQIDGVFIVVSEPSNEELEELIESDIPCVTTDLVSDRIYTVMTDNIYGASLAVQKLYERGHRRIAHIAGPEQSIAGYERIMGYRKGLRAVGLSEDEDLIWVSEYFTFEAGYRTAGKVLQMDKPPTGIFVGSDDIAFGVMRRLIENGIDIPGDIAIIGFDDIPFAKYYQPPLATMKQNKKKIGVEAAKYLLASIENQEKNPDFGELRIKPQFIARSSI